MINRPSRRFISIVGATLAVPATGILFWLLLSPARVEQWAPLTVKGGLSVLRSLGLDLGFNEVEIIANFAVFFPIGALSFILLRQRVRWLSMAVGPLLSLCAETAQALWLPERVASVQDWALNSAGSWVGVGAAWLIAALIPRRPDGVRNRISAHRAARRRAMKPRATKQVAQGGSGVPAP